MRKIEKIKKTAGHALKELSGMIDAKEYKNAKHLWLISERGNDARDNGYWFYKHVTEKHPEVTPVYLINRDSADFHKVASLGMTVEPGSKEHYAILHAAEALISTHDCGFTPDMVAYHHYYKHGLFVPKGKKIFICHGLMNMMSQWYQASECKQDMFVVSAPEEKELIKKLGHPEEILAMTGLARYDTLDPGKTENMILVMPTWRQYLAGCSGEEFKESEFFRLFDGLIHSEKIAKILEETDHTMVFYPHVEMQKWDVFRSNNPRIRIGSFKTDDVQDLLNRAEILVTDYSSVYFDVSYMEKDIVFWQFDKDKAETQHYEGYAFDMARFGAVTKTMEETEDAIREALTHPGKRKKEQHEFFEYHDRHNCERIFNEVWKRVTGPA